VEAEPFTARLVAETAAATAIEPETVRAIVTEWIDERPLPYLFACRYPGVGELFSALRRRGKVIGVLSDYPAEAKLAMLGLAADYVIAASDPGIDCLKPHPRGLETLMAAVGARPDETIVIGDRAELDGLVARRAGAHSLIRSARPLAGWQTFARFDDPVFARLH